MTKYFFGVRKFFVFPHWCTWWWDKNWLGNYKFVLFCFEIGIQIPLLLMSLQKIQFFEVSVYSENRSVDYYEEICFLERRGNILYTRRFLTKTNRLPKWGEKFFANLKKYVPLIEESIVSFQIFTSQFCIPQENYNKSLLFFAGRS